VLGYPLAAGGRRLSLIGLRGSFRVRRRIYTFGQMQTLLGLAQSGHSTSKLAARYPLDEYGPCSSSAIAMAEAAPRPAA